MIYLHLSTPIKNLKDLRDKDIDNFDKSIGNLDNLEGISQNNPICLSEVKELVDFALFSIVRINYFTLLIS